MCCLTRTFLSHNKISQIECAVKCQRVSKSDIWAQKEDARLSELTNESREAQRQRLL